MLPDRIRQACWQYVLAEQEIESFLQRELDARVEAAAAKADASNRPVTMETAQWRERAEQAETQLEALSTQLEELRGQVAELAGPAEEDASARA